MRVFLIPACVVLLSCCSEPCITVLPKLYERDQQWIAYSYEHPVPFVRENGETDSMYTPPSIYYIATSEYAMLRMKSGDSCLKVGGYSTSFFLTLDSLRIDFNIHKDPQLLFLNASQSELSDTMKVNIIINDVSTGKYAAFNALDTSQMRCVDSLHFNGQTITEVFENVSASEVLKRFLISPVEGIIYLELQDGRSWTKQNFAVSAE